MKRVAILQSNYIPWKGYFDIINSVDEFIFYDEVQYTIRDWRNRNQIKTNNGLKWLSIPIIVSGHLQKGLKISQAKIQETKWAISHWDSIKQAYKNTPFFKEYKERFEELYAKAYKLEYLCEVNYMFIEAINDILGIKTLISFDKDYVLKGDKQDRLISLCKQVGANEYLSGPAAKSYIDVEYFKKQGIDVKWMDYSNYLEYHQAYPPFAHNVSVIDLIFSTGKNAKTYLKSYCAGSGGGGF